MFLFKAKKHGRQYSNRFIHLFYEHKLTQQSLVKTISVRSYKYTSNLIIGRKTDIFFSLFCMYMYINILILFFTLRH